MRNSTFVYMVKTESVYKVTICGLKMMVKSGLNFFFEIPPSLHKRDDFCPKLQIQ